MRRKRSGPFVLWLVPILGLLFVFSLGPILASLVLSFYDYDFGQTPEPVGLANYVEAFHDPVLGSVMRNILFYTVLTVPIEMLLSLFIAQLIHSVPRYRAIFRVAYFLPVMTPAVAAAAVWKFVYQPQFGLLNGLLARLSLPTPNWLNSSALVIPALSVVWIWFDMGYNVVLFLAGLLGVPRQLIDAAKIDGANGWQIFWRIVFPLLGRTTVYAMVTTTVVAVQLFNLPHVMTRGGPEDASRTPVMYVYEQGFYWLRMGYASAVAYILFILVLIIVLIQLRLMRADWNY
ncbi:MAG: sugar ABC transporter permease [Chloroflexi bacterium]|nr:sugar ABC transporter permease [Chloroflexota bacterium]